MWDFSLASFRNNKIPVLIVIFLSFGLTKPSFGEELFEISSRCYTKRYYPFPYDFVFEALKETFLRANFTFKNMNKESGFIFGTGIIKQGKKAYFLNISANIIPKEDVTVVNILANYIQMKKEHAHEAAGLNGVIFPIPIFWKKEMVTKDMGVIEDPNFYIVFFANLNKVIFEEIMKSPDISIFFETANLESFTSLAESCF